MKLSIIVACYNIEQYIERCISSILPQLSSETELIVINDGSTDSSPQILKELHSKSPIFIIRDYENGGLATARNRGLKEAKGEYVWFVDGDDYILDCAVCKLLETIAETNCDIIAFNHAQNTHDGIVNKYDYKWAEFDISDFLLINSRHFAWNKIYSRRLFESFRFVDGLRNIEDYVFNMSVSVNVKSVQTLPDVLYVYEQTNLHSISRDRSLRNLVRLANETYKAHKILINQLPNVSDVRLHRVWTKSLNTSYAGMIFSLFRFYNCKRVKSGIQFYKSIGVYPFKYCGNYREKSLVLIANNKIFWPFAHLLKLVLK